MHCTKGVWAYRTVRYAPYFPSSSVRKVERRDRIVTSQRGRCFFNAAWHVWHFEAQCLHHSCCVWCMKTSTCSFVVRASQISVGILQHKDSFHKCKRSYFCLHLHVCTLWSVYLMQYVHSAVALTAGWGRSSVSLCDVDEWRLWSSDAAKGCLDVARQNDRGSSWLLCPLPASPA